MNLVKRNPSNEWLTPFRVMSEMEEEMGRFFSGALRSYGEGLLFAPDIDLTEDGENYFVKADLPGLQKEDLEISVTGDVLTLKGERKEETEKKGKNSYRAERRFGAFQRVMELPTEVDSGKIKAVFKNGVLDLTLPKAESAKPKQIKVDIQ